MNMEFKIDNKKYENIKNKIDVLLYTLDDWKDFTINCINTYREQNLDFRIDDDQRDMLITFMLNIYDTKKHFLIRKLKENKDRPEFKEKITKEQSDKFKKIENEFRIFLHRNKIVL